VVPKISLLSSLLPIAFFILFCFKTSLKGFWVIFIYCTTSILFDVFVAASAWGMQHKLLLWNVYGIFEFLILAFFYFLVTKQRLIRLLIILFSVLYLIFFSLSYRSDNDQFNSMMSSIGSVIILILSLSYIITSLAPSSIPVDVFTPIFLIVVGILFYVSSTLFLYLIANNLSNEEMQNYWRINDYSNILTNIIFSASFLLYRFQHKNPPPESHSVDFTSSKNDR
jgi:hypothetical protein